MIAIAEKIHEEVQRLPENLANQVYDFIRFIEARHGIRSHEEDLQCPDWDSFFKRHTRTVTDATPFDWESVEAWVESGPPAPGATVADLRERDLL